MIMAGMDTPHARESLPQREGTPPIAAGLDEMDKALVMLDDAVTELAQRLSPVRSSTETTNKMAIGSDSPAVPFGSPLRDRLGDLTRHAVRISSRVLEVMGELEC